MGAPDAAYPGDGLARRASRPGEIMKQLLPLHFAFDFSFADLNEKQFPDTAPALNSKFQQRAIFEHDIYEIFCKFAGLARIRQYPNHVSMICRRPFGRIDDVALRRWALFTVE